MMARASGTIPTYTPSLYLPGSMGRYRQYPRVVRTPIPGANVKAGRMVWGEQVMNLWGAKSLPFSVARVPLLGLGQIAWPSWLNTETRWGVAGFVLGAVGMHLAMRRR